MVPRRKPTFDMNPIFLLLFVFCNALLTVATAPTSRPHNTGGFDLNQEMDIFKELLQKQFATAKAKVKELKQTTCKEIKTCNNQILLFKELLKAHGNKNSTFPNLLSMVSPSPNTPKSSTKSSFLKT